MIIKANVHGWGPLLGHNVNFVGSCPTKIVHTSRVRSHITTLLVSYVCVGCTRHHVLDQFIFCSASIGIASGQPFVYRSSETWSNYLLFLVCLLRAIALSQH